MRVLTLGMFLFTSLASAKGTLDKNATHLIDHESKKMYRFYEMKGIHFAVASGKNQEQTYQIIKKQVDALTKEKNPSPLKGNPASVFCAERLKGKNLNFVDLTENEFAICQLPDGILVDAWDVFRMKNN